MGLSDVKDPGSGGLGKLFFFPKERMGIPSEAHRRPGRHKTRREWAQWLGNAGPKGVAVTATVIGTSAAALAVALRRRMARRKARQEAAGSGVAVEPRPQASGRGRALRRRPSVPVK